MWSVAALTTLLCLGCVHAMPRTVDLDADIASPCPCKDAQLCQPISTKYKTEVFAFSVKNDEKYWNLYDWSKLTTVVTADYFNVSLVCLAHSHNARVTYMASVDEKTFLSPALREKWIATQVATIKEHYLDGLNFDYEGAIAQNETDKRDAYTALVKETRERLLKEFPHSQIAVDVGFKPNVDMRFYDYPALARYSDFLVLMAYNEASQIYGDCLALPNSPIDKTIEAALQYTDMYLNISLEQIVVAYPWFGIVYKCLKVEGEKCFIEKVPYRGAPCSDSPGKPYDYKDLEEMARAKGGLKWNGTSETPYFTYKDESTGKHYQAQYDNPDSLQSKYAFINMAKLRGVGIFTIDMLDYTDSDGGKKMRSDFFGQLPKTKKQELSSVSVKKLPLPKKQELVPFTERQEVSSVYQDADQILPSTDGLDLETLQDDIDAADLINNRAPCPCSDPKLCEPIKDRTRKEVVAFSVQNREDHWRLFDWSKITTVVMFNYLNTSLMCMAHSHGVRAVLAATPSKTVLFSPAKSTAWVQEHRKLVYQNYLDGLNIDFEDACSPQQHYLRKSYTAIVTHTYKAFTALMPHTMISIDVIDDGFSKYRYYDYQALSKVSDFFFIMAYDESGGHNVGPNSGYKVAKWAINSFLKKGIPAHKLVLGLPWYGDVYECDSVSGDVCHPKRYSGHMHVSQVCYCALEDTLRHNTSAYRWNSKSQTPFFTYKSGTATYQAQFDDPRSLSIKYKLAQQMNIRGVGIWHIDCLNYSDDDYNTKMRAGMFDPLPSRAEQALKFVPMETSADETRENSVEGYFKEMEQDIDMLMEVN